jgi:hypothetical protein
MNDIKCLPPHIFSTFSNKSTFKEYASPIYLYMVLAYLNDDSIICKIETMQSFYSLKFYYIVYLIL